MSSSPSEFKLIRKWKNKFYSLAQRKTKLIWISSLLKAINKRAEINCFQQRFSLGIAFWALLGKKTFLNLSFLRNTIIKNWMFTQISCYSVFQCRCNRFFIIVSFFTEWPLLKEINSLFSRLILLSEIFAFCSVSYPLSSRHKLVQFWLQNKQSNRLLYSSQFSMTPDDNINLKMKWIATWDLIALHSVV